MRDTIQKYFELEQVIHEHFGYEENWHVYKLDDLTDQYWTVGEDPTSKFVAFHDEYLTQDLIDSDLFYSGIVHKDEFLDKSIYETEHYTMILVDSQADGNKLLSIFSNAKKIDITTLNFGE